MPADPWEYSKPWQNCCDLRFCLALTILKTFMLLIKCHDFGTEIQLLLVKWIIFSKEQSACLYEALGESDCFDHLSVLGGPF